MKIYRYVETHYINSGKSVVTIDEEQILKYMKGINIKIPKTNFSISNNSLIQKFIENHNCTEIKPEEPLIKSLELFATPKTQEEISDWINGHPEMVRGDLYVVMGLTWNYLSNAVEEWRKTNV
jgi:glutaredoxin-related protein